MQLQSPLVVAVASLALVAAPVAAEEADAPSAAVEEESSGPPQTTYWLLEEFDWGDDEEVVAESILFDPYYRCTGMVANPCILVSTVVDREKLLAHFHHHRGGLWQVVILTPDLSVADARRHMPRVWGVLVDYVTRMRGEPMLAVGLPDLESLEFGPPRLSHFWALDDLEVRVMVGRRDTDRFYVGAFFSDPVRGREAREPWEQWLAASDARKRARWASEAGQGAKDAKP